MLDQRINRIVGQLKGIQRMINEDRDCNEVLQQISAVKKAIDSLSKEIVLSDLNRYLASSDAQKIAQVVNQVVDM